MLSDSYVRIALKTAILRTDRTQRAFSMRVGIPEVRLSLLIRGKAEPTSDENASLSAALHQPSSVLFRRVRVPSRKNA
jgi:hypothetical protein